MKRVVSEDRKEAGSEVDRVYAGRFSLASDRQSRRHVRDPSDGHRLGLVISRTSGHDTASEDTPMRRLHHNPEVQSLVPPNRSGARGTRPARLTATKSHEARDAQAQKWNSHGDGFESKPLFSGGRRRPSHPAQQVRAPRGGLRRFMRPGRPRTAGGIGSRDVLACRTRRDSGLCRGL
jgi:hypothetical protein